jgi:hypothetical protein
MKIEIKVFDNKSNYVYGGISVAIFIDKRNIGNGHLVMFKKRNNKIILKKETGINSLYVKGGNLKEID